MCTPATEPARTITTHGHQSLVSIEPRRGRHLPDARAARDPGRDGVHPDYRVLGNRREKVRQLGNGVTPPAAEWLIRAVVESLSAGGRAA
jgi:DNA (cytosine-5)-methyltransferase 1